MTGRLQNGQFSIAKHLEETENWSERMTLSCARAVHYSEHRPLGKRNPVKNHPIATKSYSRFRIITKS
jgi:hypothetical protein